MIFKLAQSFSGTTFQKNSRTVKAMRIVREDFMYETQHGWVQGYQGQWLVEIGERLRCNVDHEAFQRSYKPVEKRKRKA